MNKQKTKPFFRLRIMDMISLFAICSLATLFLLSPNNRIAINRLLWEITKPKEYQMEVSEISNEGLWRWQVHVQKNNSLSVQLLTRKMSGFGEEESWLQPDNLTIEHIFNAASQFCAGRGFTKCRLKFDSRFHYPTLIDSYEVIIIEVERFALCEEGSDACLPLQ